MCTLFCSLLKIILDGQVYNVGGVLTNIPRGYLNRTALAADTHLDHQAFHFVSYSTSPPQAPFPYSPRRFAPKDIVWPPKGLRLEVTFKAARTAPAAHQAVTVVVTYEVYDGIPLLAKWLTVSASPEGAAERVKAAISSVEYLNLNHQWATSGYNWLFIDTNAPHGASVSWGTDPTAHNMPGSFQPIVNCTFTNYFTVTTNQAFESYKVCNVLLIINSSRAV